MTPTIVTGIKAKGPLSGNFHCHINLRGTQKANEMFLALLKWIDIDAPVEEKRITCGECGGVVWSNPLLSPLELTHLHAQLKETLEPAQPALADQFIAASMDMRTWDNCKGRSHVNESDWQLSMAYR